MPRFGYGQRARAVPMAQIIPGQKSGAVPVLAKRKYKKSGKNLYFWKKRAYLILCVSVNKCFLKTCRNDKRF
jgi:hypothetical protein